MSSFEDSNNPGYDHLMGEPASEAKGPTVKSTKNIVDALPATSIPSFEESNGPGYDSLIVNAGAMGQKFKR